MKSIFRISGAAVLAAASSLVLVPASTPALGQSSQSITCQPSTVSVAPSSGSLVVSCTSPGGGTPPPSCSVSVSKSLLTSGGGPVTVTASNCGTITSWSGTSPTTAIATANGQTPIPSSFIDNLPTNTGATTVSYSYSVVGSSGTNSASVSVSGTGSGGGGGTTSCGTPVTFAWSASGYERQTVTVAAGGTSMAQFTVASPTISSQPRIIVSNSGGTYRPTWALSPSPCVFPTSSDPVIGGPSASTTAYIWYLLSGTATSWEPVLSLGNTYYINLKNTSSKSQSFYVDLYN